ncbi:hypothetical protein Agub_g2066 [Astrephomene gubernaculifera]|uniref:RRM domain-containing protein n=1 Tax=Astrephomene gubernaculifera TaxID=47775 RepID=A0AAD3DH05_9CHLO|nr:hypothetical protein Agub_g2066 [Astrephomene gubernaculifera]
MQASLHAAFQDSLVLEEQLPLDQAIGQSRTLLDDPTNQDNRQLFFAKVLRSATEDEVRRLFGQFGKVTDVNLFRAFQGAPTTKGCGLVTMGSHAEAVAAIAALDSQYVWEGMETPMVVKWMDTALQRRRREQHLANMRQAMTPGAGMNFVPSGLALATSLPVASNLNLVQNSFLDALEPMETPPPGCAPDAIKLFVGNVPKSCTEEQLLPLFQSVGKVVELVIVHDKVTHESKGSAFVWYATRVDAERAVLQFNFRHVLPDPSGDQDRPLVVRRAKTRAKPLKHTPLLGSLAQVQPSQLAATVAAGTQPFYKVQSNLVGLAGLEALQLGDSANLAQQLASAGSLSGQSGVSGLGLGSIPAYRPLPNLAGQLVGTQTSMYDAYTAGDQLLNDFAVSQSLQQSAAAAAAQLDVLGAAAQQQQQIAQSMTLNQTQLTSLNSHLFTVQTVSGAQLHISPGAPGLFNLVVSGTKTQVEAAKGYITTVLSHA